MNRFDARKSPARRPLVFALVAALALPISANAANYTYHGDLMDGDAPAEGAYDLRVRAFAHPGAAKAMAEAIELPGVKLSGGRFSVELDLPEDADGTTWVEVAVRKAGSNASFETLGAPQPLAKVNGTCPGAWALDGNSGAPAGSYLGFADAREVFINSPSGVVLNSLADSGPNMDLTIDPKSGGDADVDVSWRSRNGKSALFYLRDSDGYVTERSNSGGFEFIDGIPLATQNNGLDTFSFSGRLRLKAAGAGATDTSGGIWFDDERARASFVGRGDNESDWTGFYEGTGGWRFTAHDNGAFGFNTNTEALPANTFKVNAPGGVRFNHNSPFNFGADFEIGSISDPSGGDLDLRLWTASGKSALFNVSDTTGSLSIVPSGGGARVSVNSNLGLARDAATNRLEVEGNASKTGGGNWLTNSDRRIKTEIAPIPNALDAVMKLRPVTFRYAVDYRKAHDSIGGERYYSVIAQEFTEVFPDAVKGSGEYLPGKAKTPENEILQVDTYPAQITAIAAIQELAVQDDALRAEVATLKDDNDALREQLGILMRRLDSLERQQEH